MQVPRTYTRVSLIVLFAIVSVVMGTNLKGLDWPGIGSFGSTATVEASAASTKPEAAPVLVGCPAVPIDGILNGTGSSDHPFTTGLQTSRLFRNSVESTCGTPKPTPSLTDAGVQFRYDAFEFENLLPFQSICVTVITTAGSNNQLLTAAYLGSFNPANVQQNYVGDAGNSDKTRSFSFIVPGGEEFIIVQSRVNNAANPPSLAYSFRVLGLPGCPACPPTSVSGTVGEGSNDYPASIDTQTGRLFRNAVASTCDDPKTTPTVEDPETQFAYDAFTFLNSSSTPKCITVSTTAGGNNQLLFAAYVDRFNPFNVQENYLGDTGNSNKVRTFSVTVPGKRSFVIVVSRVNIAGSPTSLEYDFSFSGLTGCDCVATLSKSSESFAANGGTGSVNVTIPAGCGWRLNGFGQPFLHITSGSSGTGNGTVHYSVDANAAANTRIGTLAIAGKSFEAKEGINFADVPLGAPFYTEIGKLSARGVTLGCGNGLYCPSQAVTREQMAAFIIRAVGEPVPQPTQQRFNDVPNSNPFFAFIDQMAVRQITLGCSTSPALYCPANLVTREQMAAFLIRGKGEFTPPVPPNQRFADVPPSNPFYAFIDRMAVLGITQGCGTNPLRYCPASEVTREQMAAFLVRAFGL